MTNQTPIPNPARAETQVAAAVPTTLEWYAIFCGDINLINVQKLSAGLMAAMQANVTRIHLLFHTWGGIAGDGVYLYNLLKQLPIDVVLYNAGQVASAGAIAFLGARSRKTTNNAIFMVHRSHNSAQFASAAKLKNISDSLVLDDTRTETILRQHLQLPQGLWNQLEHNDVYISGADAVTYGLADQIADFAPPPGTKVLNALG